jgi:hypothetical protein
MTPDQERLHYTLVQIEQNSKGIKAAEERVAVAQLELSNAEFSLKRKQELAVRLDHLFDNDVERAVKPSPIFKLNTLSGI